MEGSELASKVPRDPGSSVKDRAVTRTKQILDLEGDCPSLKSHFLCWSLLNSMGTQGCLPFPYGRQIVFPL